MIKLKPCRRGTFIYAPTDVPEGQSLDLYGEYSEAECWFFGLVLKPGDVVVDVGAGIGCHAVAMAALVGGEGRVHAFEPDRDRFYRLCGNAAINNHTCIHCHQEALGRDRPLDALGFQNVKLLKVDVEDGFGVLDGAGGTIQRCLPYLYVQFPDDRLADGEKYMAGLGYTVYRHVAPMYSPFNRDQNANNVYKTDAGEVVSHLLVGVPPGRPSPFQPDAVANSKCALRPGGKGTTSCSYEARVRNGDFDKYLRGRGIDIGGGYDTLVVKEGSVDVWDIAQGDATHMNGAKTDYDFAYSSHCLEHIEDVPTALENWCRVVKPGGYLFVVVPDFDLYEHRVWPSRFNFDHKTSYSTTRTRAEVGRDTHYHIKNDIVPLLKKHGVTAVEIRVEDDRYDRALPDTADQTGPPYHALAQIVVVGRKKGKRK